MSIRRHVAALSIGLAACLVTAACGDDGPKGTLLVTLTSPQGDTYVKGQVTVSAQVQGEAERVALFVDGSSREVLLSEPWVFTWDSDQATEAVHRLEVIAYGANGAQGRSGELLVMVDRTAPVVELPALEWPLLFTGASNLLEAAAADEAGIASLRLLADGTLVDSCTTAECTFDWDTGGLADGEVILTVEAEDTAGNLGTLELPVLVVNDGTPIAFIEGPGTATWVIPEAWAVMDLDLKFHFNMPAGVTSMMAALQWSQADWPFDLHVGTGECPHSGTTVVETTGEGGQVVLEHDASELSLAEYAQVGWFVHMAPGVGLDMGAHVGEGSLMAFVMVLY
jgi:hypothetical protein